VIAILRNTQCCSRGNISHPAPRSHEVYCRRRLSPPLPITCFTRSSCFAASSRPLHNRPTSSWSSTQPFVCNRDIRVVIGRCTLRSTLGLRDRQMNRSKAQSDEPSGYEKSMPLPAGPRERAAVCAGDIRRLESCTLCRGSMFRLLSVSVGLLNRRISK
jgi:hypothetical protein